MGKVYIFDHPLIQHKLSLMRDVHTGAEEFRELLEEISMLMVYEVTRDLPTKEVEIETPLCKTKARHLSGKKVGIVPILRAGLGMVDGVAKLIPAARIGHIGLYRDPQTLQPVEYYCKPPADSESRELLVLDPMLATGGSASAAITFLKQRNSQAHPSGQPDCGAGGHRARAKGPSRREDSRRAACDEKLNEHGQIGARPG